MAEEDGESPKKKPPPVASDERNRARRSPIADREVTNNFAMEEQEAVSPLMLGASQEVDDFKLDGSYKPHWLKPIKSRSGRLTNNKFVQSPRSSPSVTPSLPNSHSSAPQSTVVDEAHQVKAVVAQAWEWLHTEKQKRRLRRRKSKKEEDSLDVIQEDDKPLRASSGRPRRDSSDSDASNALEQLEEILKKSAPITGILRRQTSRRKSRSLRKLSSTVRLRRHSTTGGSSDTGTDQMDKSLYVPTCEAWLDNSRTLSRTMGLSVSDETGMPYSKSMSQRERDAWSDFQYEILRIAHTLQLRRWRRVPLDRSDEVVVERLSGALTNAVYTVSPPRDLEQGRTDEDESNSHETTPRSKRSRPVILLLRIYGPQVEHLIDRDAELQVLRRLGRQNIGPRLLGTFNNGRFEEYLYAKPLQPIDLRQPEVSRQIAKRMRELHDGIELTKEERRNGPFVWRNWDKWVGRCEKIVSYIDGQVLARGATSSAIKRLRERGFVCGTPWVEFRHVVERYRNELNKIYGGSDQLKHELIFAHNDTQYGNILRQEPPGESPLLLPANVHKQLVVIDFEYSNANTRGLEFANHFTEWCYNYHHPDSSFECQTSYYPTPEEQRRFIHAYLEHRPQYAPAATTPRLRPARSSVSSISTVATTGRTPSFPALEKQISNSTSSSFKLDEPAMSPGVNGSASSLDLHRPETHGSDPTTKEKAELEGDIANLIHETRLWRIANSAQWMAWGIVQARVPGLPNEPHTQIVRDTATEWTQSEDKDGCKGDEGVLCQVEEEEDQEFDYLSYARSRAMFFWGDCVQQGLVKVEDLPVDVREAIKIVNY